MSRCHVVWPFLARDRRLYAVQCALASELDGTRRPDGTDRPVHRLERSLTTGLHANRLRPGRSESVHSSRRDRSLISGCARSIDQSLVKSLTMHSIAKSSIAGGYLMSHDAKWQLLRERKGHLAPGAPWQLAHRRRRRVPPACIGGRPTSSRPDLLNQSAFLAACLLLALGMSACRGVPGGWRGWDGRTGPWPIDGALDTCSIHAHASPAGRRVAFTRVISSTASPIDQ